MFFGAETQRAVDQPLSDSCNERLPFDPASIGTQAVSMASAVSATLNKLRDKTLIIPVCSGYPR